ncbi:TetR family transcriptional regulator C-terminal domain-containing protein [Pseudooceanicola sp. HF7]|uniref:TetR family transcriptional regulator C-terminal domain-containing protein n=1 Tax=Pseudooceanicola sp. HF7 TaxID=2721560 RepID=UPI001430C052|nr:TetR family transcriptional regulator C-terminal domain-containing protein [Pseudooceanicola sp. HF7]NIZ10244.1 TetR family transcriptional regulator [Pseudooceanicola sp. HF7]
MTTTESPPGQKALNIRNQNISRILEAATEIFARKGYDGTRMAAIAELADLPKANVYYYFGTKEDIYQAVLQRMVGIWEEAISVLDPNKDPFTCLEEYVRVKLNQSRDYPAEARVMLTEMIAGGQHLTPEMNAFLREVAMRQIRVVEAWIDQGRIRPVHPRHFLIALWSATQFYAECDTLAATVLEVDKLRQSDFDTAGDTLAATLLRGLRPDSA